MVGFDYPIEPYVRRHGPTGYTDYESYREWLRDEFVFRCVYCLHREQWYGRGAAFHIDHFTPVAQSYALECDYSNLLYACATCNEAKKAVLNLPNPCAVAFHDCLRVKDDGRVEALNTHGEILMQVLKLNSEKNVRTRSRWMRILETCRKTDTALYEELLGFPDDLPDLRKLRPPNNSKPEGAMNCYLAMRERGELPATY
jgi:hypothetical protein